MGRQYSLEKTRNIGIMAHIDAGKTTTTERILYYTGINHKIGETHDGGATNGLDGSGTRAWYYNYFCCYNMHNGKVTELTSLIPLDTLTSQLKFKRSLRVLDGSVTVLCAKGGVEPQSETVWRQADEYNVPRMIFVNKMDIMGADFYNVVNMVHDRLKR